MLRKFLGVILLYAFLLPGVSLSQAPSVGTAANAADGTAGSREQGRVPLPQPRPALLQRTPT